MKKWALFFLAVLCCVCMGTAYADGMCGDNLNWTLKNGTLTISGTGAMDDWEYMRDKPWSEKKSEIERVIIEEGCTHIGSSAFDHFINLKKIEIPEGVVSIGGLAFANCYKLEEITLPTTLSSIGHMAFSYCFELEKIALPATLSSIGRGAFMECKKLTSISVAEDSEFFVVVDGVIFNPDRTTLCYYLAGDQDTYHVPETVRTIGKDAFHGAGLEQITLPEGLITIEESAFGSSAIKQITIPSSVQTIGKYAFYACDNLEEITIPSAVQTIGGKAFQDCDKLNRIIVEGMDTNFSDEGIASIDKYSENKNLVIYGLNGSRAQEAAARDGIPFSLLGESDGALTGKCGANLTWTLKDDVLTISGTGAMDEWEDYKDVPWDIKKESIQRVVIETGCTSISKYAFFCCRALTGADIPASVTTMGDAAFSTCKNLKEVKLSEGLISIGYEAFEDCDGLIEVVLPASLSSISSQAFFDCNALNAIQVAEGSKYFASVDGVLFSNDMTTLYYYPMGKQDSTYIVPETVRVIANSALARQIALQKVMLPEGLITIENLAFAGNRMDQITIPSTVQTIGNSAFFDCENLVRFTVAGMDTEFGEAGVFDEEYRNKQLVIYGLEGSKAQEAAKREKIPFDIIEWVCSECNATVVGSTICPACEIKKKLSAFKNEEEKGQEMETEAEVEPTAFLDAWTCAQCGTALTGGNFCHQCGAAKPKVQTCAACGYTVPDGMTMKFCPECGGALE